MASERPEDGSVSSSFTRPTETPEMRTSASWESWVASANDVWKR